MQKIELAGSGESVLRLNRFGILEGRFTAMTSASALLLIPANGEIKISALSTLNFDTSYHAFDEVNNNLLSFRPYKYFSTKPLRSAIFSRILI